MIDPRVDGAWIPGGFLPPGPRLVLERFGAPRGMTRTEAHTSAKVAAVTRALKSATDVAKYEGGTVYIHNGWYASEPVPITGANNYVIYEGESCNLNVNVDTDKYGVVLEIPDGTDDTLFDIALECGPCGFRNIFFRGNQAGQASGTSRAIELPNAASPARAFWAERCRFERWRSGAISAGTFRDAGQLIQCLIRFNGFESDGTPVGGVGADGVLLGSCNDWRVYRSDIGGNTRNGLYGTGPGTFLSDLTNYFSNQKRGAQFDAPAQGIHMMNGNMDRNLEEGLLIVGSSASTKAHLRRILNMDFSGNGDRTNNTYSDIRIVDDASGRTRIANPCFNKGSSPRIPKHCIETAGTTAGVQVSGESYLTDANAPYATSFTNDPTKLLYHDMTAGS